MASPAWHYPRTGIWRFSGRDAGLVALAALHAAVLLAWPVAPVIALGVWWNSNTIAHNFIHRPFFRSAGMNRLFSAALSVLLGIPQALWRDRHLAHHAGIEWRLRVSGRLIVETALVLCLWAALASVEPRFFLLVYVPGYLAGLGLCALQGHWEHAVGWPTSHYGRIYNFLCFNDGYHAEHHAAPAIHWSQLPHVCQGGAAASPWPPLIRWLSVPPLEDSKELAQNGVRRGRVRWRIGGARRTLCALERLVLWSPWLQRFVLRTHRRAFCSLLPQLQPIRSVTIVGGGLFPRTALIVRELLPAARLTIVDSDPRNLETARGFLDGNIEYRNERYVPGEPRDCDLTIIPLCLDGERSDLSPSALGGGSGARLDLAPPRNRSRSFPRAAQASEPGSSMRSSTMRSASLLVVFILAKLVILWGHAAPVTGWSLVAYLWQDVMVALALVRSTSPCKGSPGQIESSGRLTRSSRSTRQSTFPWNACFPLRSRGPCFAPRAGHWPIPCGSI
jgi:hypothetical protein